MSITTRALGMLLLFAGIMSQVASVTQAGEPGIGQLSTAFPAGYERFNPYEVQFPNPDYGAGMGWFAQVGMTIGDIEFYRMMGFRPIDIEVEKWGTAPVFSAIFVQNEGDYEADDWKIVIGSEKQVRDACNLDGGFTDTANPEPLIPYRVMDLEVHPFGPEPAGYGTKLEEGYWGIPDEMCALLVSNTGKHYTPYSDFIVYAGDIEAFAIWMKSHPVDVRLIDHEYSTDVPEKELSNPETVQANLNSLIVVSNVSAQEVETEMMSFETPLELELLMKEGWQPIDIERTPENLLEYAPGQYQTFSGIFVRSNNLFNFHPDLPNYDPAIWIVGPTNSVADVGSTWRMVDLDLIRHKGTHLLDEVYIPID